MRSFKLGGQLSGSDMARPAVAGRSICDIAGVGLGVRQLRPSGLCGAGNDTLAFAKGTPAAERRQAAGLACSRSHVIDAAARLQRAHLI